MNTEHNGADEKNAIAAAVLGAEEAPMVPGDIELGGELRNDMGNQRRFRARYGHDLIFVEEVGWLVWDGLRWNAEHGTAQATIRAHQTVEKIFDEGGAFKRRAKEKIKSKDLDKTVTAAEDEQKSKDLFKWANKSCGSGFVTAMMNSARPYLTKSPDQLDQEDWAICCHNGVLVVDGAENIKLWPHRRDHFNTRLAPVDFLPKSDCPKWLQQIADTLPNEQTSIYFQKWMGYSLVGDIAHQLVTFLEGQGSNGKSTLLEVICEIIGDYAATTGIETFLHDKGRSGSGPSPDLARLPGARLVRTSEPEAGVRLSESRLKIWTGGEKMTARNLNKGFFEFRPRGKLTISVNVKPTIVGKDDGIRRRIRVIPFKRQFGMVDDKGEPLEGSAPKKNQAQLVDDLLAERSGIFNWLLDGLRMVLEDGLDAPPEVIEATRNYFTEMDPIGQFFAECTRRVDGYVPGCGYGEVAGDVLYDVYEKWCDGAGETVKNKTAFGRRCSDMGYPKRPSNGRIYRGGLELEQAWVPVKKTYSNKDDD